MSLPCGEIRLLTGGFSPILFIFIFGENVMYDLILTQKTFKDWMLENFNHNELKDLARFGAQNGFHGLIYYYETSALYQKYYEDIWDMAHEDAENQGITPLEMIASFGGACNVVDHLRFVNLMNWYDAERVAFELTESEN